MKSKLFAWGVLLAAGLMHTEDYAARLHALFLETPDDPLLLALEECTSSL